MQSDSKLIKLFKKQRNVTKRSLGDQYDNTRAARSFYAGNQMDYQDRVQFADGAGRRRVATVNFNDVQSNVDAVVGFMAQNRRQAKYIAHVNSSESQNLYSKNMNALYSFHRDYTNADQLETDQDADMMVNGYGAIETDLTYVIGNSTTNPNGSITKQLLDPLKIGWDPHSRGKNVLDARWVYYYEDYDLMEALDLFQKSKESDFECVDDKAPLADGGYVYNPYGGLYDKIKLSDSVEWTAKSEDMVRVYTHQWFEYETFYKAENPLYSINDQMGVLYAKARLDVIAADAMDDYEDGDMNAMTRDDAFKFDTASQTLIFDSKLRTKLVAEFGELIKPVSFVRKCFYTAVYSGDHIFSKFRSVSQTGFSVKFKTGVYNDERKFWMGMVNSMMEPQKYRNKALTEFMFTIATNSKGGVMIERDAVEDIADFSTKWAKTDAVIVVESGAIAAGKIQQKAQPALPTGLDSLINLCDANLAANGVNPAMLGNADDNESGLLYKRRIRSAISKLARYFDSLTLYQKEDARLCVDLIRVWVENNSGSWVRITGPDGSDEFLTISEDMLAADYDVSIQEAPSSPEDQQETATMLTTLAQQLAAAGAQGPATTFLSEALQYMPIDGDVRNRLIQSLQPKQEDPQVAQLKLVIQQLQNQLTQVQIENTKADTRKKDADAMLATSKVKESDANAVNKHASTLKVMEDAEGQHIENQKLRKGGYSKVNVNI